MGGGQETNSTQAASPHFRTSMFVMFTSLLKIPSAGSSTLGVLDVTLLQPDTERRKASSFRDGLYFWGTAQKQLPVFWHHTGAGCARPEDPYSYAGRLVGRSGLMLLWCITSLGQGDVRDMLGTLHVWRAIPERRDLSPFCGCPS